jgi:hypothetical protein
MGEAGLAALARSVDGMIRELQVQGGSNSTAAA